MGNKKKCEHDWDIDPENSEFRVGCAGECLRRGVKCSKCGKTGDEVYSWVGFEENN